MMLKNQLDRILGEIQKSLEEKNSHVERIIQLNEENILRNQKIVRLSEEARAVDQRIISALKQIKGNYLAIIEILVRLIEVSDPDTHGHCGRVKDIAMAIARDLNLPEADIVNLELAGLLHDIGKIGIPPEILNKGGKLTEEEYEIVKKHPEIASNILGDANFLEDSRKIIYQHHERVDGKGYPQQLESEEIELAAKVLAVADAYDAMTSRRPYREKPLTKKEAIEELKKCKGSQFDTKVVKAFIDLLNRREELFIKDSGEAMG